MDIDVQITTCKMDIGIQIINILVDVLLFGHSNLNTNVQLTIVVFWTPTNVHLIIFGHQCLFNIWTSMFI